MAKTKEKKREIVWVQNDECVDEKTRKPVPRLEFNSQWVTPEDVCSRDITTATASQLAELCDQACENANYHDFVGAHEKLAKLIDDAAGPDASRKVLLAIAEAGGLHEINCR